MANLLKEIKEGTKLYDVGARLSPAQIGKLKVEITKSRLEITCWTPDSDRIDLDDSSEILLETESPDLYIEKITENLGTIMYKADRFFKNGFTKLSLKEQKKAINKINAVIDKTANYQGILTSKHALGVVNVHQGRIIQLSRPYLNIPEKSSN